jgi:hypothetical protein
MVQIDYGASVEPQLFVSLKPSVTVMLPIDTGVVPGFVTVTGCGTPARVNVSEEVENVIGPPAPANPLPDIGIESGALMNPPDNNNVAFLGPTAEGVNVTCI